MRADDHGRATPTASRHGLRESAGLRRPRCSPRGGVSGSLVFPTLLDRVPEDARVWADEAFAPVAALATYRTFDEALERVNDSRFGLQAGVFTRDVEKIQRAFANLEVGRSSRGTSPRGAPTRCRTAVSSSQGSAARDRAGQSRR